MNSLRVRILCLAALLLGLASVRVAAQPLRFAWLSDTHLSAGSRHFDDRRFCIGRINADPSIAFTILSGDVTNFGSDSEIEAAKALLDSLQNPYYVLAGNHDTKWSESGGETFFRVFGYEHIDFEAGGIRFLGCPGGPMMRMAPGQTPSWSLHWLDSTLRTIPARQRVVFVNHYPQDSCSLNYFKVLNLLKTRNIQLVMAGHRHQRTVTEFSGIPGVLSACLEKKGTVCYNIVEVDADSLRISECSVKTLGRSRAIFPPEPWFAMALKDAPRYRPDSGCGARRYLPADYPWTGYAVNDSFPAVQVKWERDLKCDIGSGAAIKGDKVAVADAGGVVHMLNAFNGKEIWSFATGSRVYSTPAMGYDRLVLGATDGTIYCLRIRDGSLIWRYTCGKAVVASPVICNKTVYCGASDGAFRALDLATGALLWKYADVAGFVECRAWADTSQVVFGDWEHTLYSLSPSTGELQWKWVADRGPMYSPAAVWPVKADGRIFITTPHRKTFCLDAATGRQLWEAPGGRESIARSPDGSRVYVKDMMGTLHAFGTGEEPVEIWNAETGLGYDIVPTPSAVRDTLVFVPSDKGLISCLGASGTLLWQHKVSTGMINSIVPVRQRHLLICTGDGIVTMLKY